MRGLVAREEGSISRPPATLTHCVRYRNDPESVTADAEPSSRPSFETAASRPPQDEVRSQRGGMNVGPTERTLRLPESLSAAAAGGVASAGGAAVVAAGWVPAGCLPFVCPFGAGGGAESCFARSSVTTTSPGSTASSLPSASAQLCPGRLQLHEGLNSLRYFSAFANDV